MQHMTMDAPAPPASTSLYNLEPKWTNQNGATVPLGAFSGKPVVDRARALIDIPQLFVVVNLWAGCSRSRCLCDFSVLAGTILGIHVIE